MRPRLPLRPRRLVDPGPEWADAVLAPLRRVRAECDVAPRVMDRVCAAARAATGDAAAGPPPRVAWTAALALGGASLALLVATLMVLVATGDDGVVAALRSVAALGRALLGFWGRLATVAFALLGAVTPLLRAVREILEVAGPILSTAGTTMALGGILAILYSMFAFARARHAAPRAGLQGGFR
jgi:hypothetical protein